MLIALSVAIVVALVGLPIALACEVAFVFQRRWRRAVVAGVAFISLGAVALCSGLGLAGIGAWWGVTKAQQQVARVRERVEAARTTQAGRDAAWRRHVEALQNHSEPRLLPGIDDAFWSDRGHGDYSRFPLVYPYHVES